MSHAPLATGSTIGIVGGGQLGRMLALAAAPLGYHCHIFAPDEMSPAALVSESWTRADYTDEVALATFAAAVDVVTYEFENVPVATAEFLSARVPVFPGAEALRVAQDRVVEKKFLNDHGIATAPWAAVDTLADLEAAAHSLGLPAVLKTRRFGYDGKGQAMLKHGTDLAAAFASLGGKDLIFEGFVDFVCEVSVIVARSATGACVTYPVSENRHAHHILAETIVPATISTVIEAKACKAAETLAAELDYVGVLALEMFVGSDGETILANEFAPRVHNSGHWTIEGAKVSQFENHIRAICGLPLGSTALQGAVEMRNLIGDDVNDWVSYLEDPHAHLHLYGKREAKPGRKMGHVTWVR